jgi:hypothetical protein
VKINYKIISSCIGSAPDFGVNFPGVRFRLLVFVLSHFVFFLFFILIQGKKFLGGGGGDGRKVQGTFYNVQLRYSSSV